MSKGDEVCIFRNEVCFAANANHDTAFIVGSSLGNHHTFFRFTVASFGSYFLALLAQPVDGSFEIAIGFCKGFTAVHHAGTSSLAQSVDILSTDCYS
ncbi:hypothetical protein D9M69_708030 [compost metagenome]